jgi:hypothetical protein
MSGEDGFSNGQLGHGSSTCYRQPKVHTRTRLAVRLPTLRTQRDAVSFAAGGGRRRTRTRIREPALPLGTVIRAFR